MYIVRIAILLYNIYHGMLLSYMDDTISDIICTDNVEVGMCKIQSLSSILIMLKLCKITCLEE